MRILFLALLLTQSTRSALKVDTHIVCNIINDTSHKVQLLAQPRKMVKSPASNVYTPIINPCNHLIATMPAQSSKTVEIKCIERYTAISESTVKIQFTEGTCAIIVIDGKARSRLALHSGKTYSILAHLKPPLHPGPSMQQLFLQRTK